MSKPDMDRTVAGVACRQVLAVLSDYVDGELASEEVRRVEAHLRGCDQCERFGGAFGRLVAGLRQELAAAGPMDPAVSDRLRSRLTEGA